MSTRKIICARWVWQLSAVAALCGPLTLSLGACTNDDDVRFSDGSGSGHESDNEDLGEGGSGTIRGNGEGEGPDLTAPTLRNTTPTDGATDVPTSTALGIEFSERMDRNSIQITSEPALALGEGIWSDDDTLLALPTDAPLALGTQYTIRVSGTDVAGNALAADTSFGFGTTPEGDAAPVISDTTPKASATDVSVNTALTVTFSEPMAEGSVRVTLQPAKILGEAQRSPDGMQISFPNAEPFRADTQYTVLVEGSDRSGNSLAGVTNFSFKTGTSFDLTAPRVLAITPSYRALGVPVDSSIVIFFSEAMDVQRTTAAISITPNIECTNGWVFSAEGDTVTCTPATPLPFATSYRIDVASRAEDRARNRLVQSVFSSFRTQESGSPEDNTPPSIVSTTPVSSTHGVARNSPITVVFSEAMDVSSVEAAFRVTAPADVTGRFDWTRDAQTLTFWPGTEFAQGTFVSFEVGADAKDLNGNAKGKVDRFLFRVLREATLELPCVEKLSGTIVNKSADGQRLELLTGRLIAGDRALRANSYRPLLGFDLKALPASLINLIDAQLFARARVVFGNPIGDPESSLGKLEWQHLDLGPVLVTEGYALARLEHVGNAGVLADDDGLGWKQTSVLQSVRNDWSNREARAYRSEYRLQFEKPTNDDSVSDQLIFGSCSGARSDRPFLRIRYEYP